eukprot:scaffold456_cov390-Prasinococcus_capsulatus_cf.AAC.8
MVMGIAAWLDRAHSAWAGGAAPCMWSADHRTFTQSRTAAMQYCVSLRPPSRPVAPAAVPSPAPCAGSLPRCPTRAHRSCRSHSIRVHHKTQSASRWCGPAYVETRASHTPSSLRTTPPQM